MATDNDEDISKNHSQLLKSVAELDHNVLKIKKSERSELTSEISEFNLIRSGITDEEPVRLENLVNTLRGQDQSFKLNNQFKAAKKRAKVLPKPLEKPADERLKRQVCFENTTESLKKWDPIVIKNRVAEHLVFPINNLAAKKLSDKEKVKPHRILSELEKEYALLEPEEPEDNESKINKFSLTKAEMILRAQENAKFRAQQSYKAEKARRKNKIKSKKFRKIEKKAKIKQQFQEFDKLQKSNPELALQKLEELDKARAHERMSLKHKNTGQWARNKQIRAKYDKESRQVLAQQLSISRELTQKVKKDDSEDEEELEFETSPSKTTSTPLEYNPWVNNEIFSLEPAKDNSEEELEKNEQQIPKRKSLNPVERVTVEYVEGEKEKAAKKSGVKRKMKELESVEATEVNKVKKVKDTIVKKKTKKQIVDSGTTKWSVEEFEEVSEPSSLPCKKLPTVSELFETLEEENEKKALKKLKKLNRKLKNKSPSNKKLTVNSNKEDSDLSFKVRATRPILDDALDESDTRQSDELKKKGVNSDSQLRFELNKAKDATKAQKVTEIDPNKFIQVKPKHFHLKNDLPDDVTNGTDVLDDSEEEDPEETQQKIISEAFIDDDVTNEFKNEKEAYIKSSQLSQIETKLPGWGSWADKNFKTSQRKKRRVIIRTDEGATRKDKEKENLIIIDDTDAKLKQHQINDLPHPFVTVEDFEASIRAPIGRNFVPEISHRELIKPPIRTRMGTIIDPMSEDLLMKDKPACSYYIF